MSNNGPSLFSIYEFLGIFIPGIFILGWLICYFPCLESVIWITTDCCCCMAKKSVIIADAFSKEFIIAVFIVLAFVLGLIFNIIADGVFHGFRNIPELIEKSAIAQRCKSGEKYPDIVAEQYFTGNHPQELSRFYSIYVTFINILKLLFTCSKKDDLKSRMHIKYYYKAYYRIMQCNLLGNIPRLEAQVNFLRNMALLSLIFGLIFMFSFSVTPCCSCLLFSTACFIVMVNRQNKIYSLVWEGYNFIDVSMKNN